MEALLPLLLVACCVGMGVMMWAMMRGDNQKPARSNSAHSTTSAHDDEVARLRAEVDQLRAAERDIEARPERRPGTG
ncbi:MAG: hypothetical protein ACRDWI_04185 [Jiangellaceae bacterium]